MSFIFLVTRNPKYQQGHFRSKKKGNFSTTNTFYYPVKCILNLTFFSLLHKNTFSTPIEPPWKLVDFFWCAYDRMNLCEKKSFLFALISRNPFFCYRLVVRQVCFCVMNSIEQYASAFFVHPFSSFRCRCPHDINCVVSILSEVQVILFVLHLTSTRMTFADNPFLQ